MNVDSPARANMRIDNLEKLDEKILEEDDTRAYAIEFNHIYESLEEGLYELDNEIDADPDEVLEAVDERDYDTARELLEEAEPAYPSV